MLYCQFICWTLVVFNLLPLYHHQWPNLIAIASLRWVVTRILLPLTLALGASRWVHPLHAHWITHTKYQTLSEQGTISSLFEYQHCVYRPFIWWWSPRMGIADLHCHIRCRMCRRYISLTSGHPSALARLYFVSQTDEIVVLHSAHWRTDGIGVRFSSNAANFLIWCDGESTGLRFRQDKY